MKKLREEMFIFKYRTMSRALGISEISLRRWLRHIRLSLYQWNDNRKGHEPVFIGKEQIPLLYARLERSALRKMLPKQTIDLILSLKLKTHDTQSQGGPSHVAMPSNPK